MKEYNTVIFDVDGTLLDTLQDISDSINFVLNGNGYQTITLEQTKLFYSNGMRKLVELSIPMGDTDPKFDDIYQQLLEHYIGNCVNKTTPYNKILDVIGELNSLGIKLGIVSSKSQEALDTIVGKYFPGFFSAVIGDNGEPTRKTFKLIMAEALQTLDSDKENSVYVGDSEYDFVLSKNFEIGCALVTWGYRSKENFAKYEPVAMFDDPSELLQLIGK